MELGATLTWLKTDLTEKKIKPFQLDQAYCAITTWSCTPDVTTHLQSKNQVASPNPALQGQTQRMKTAALKGVKLLCSNGHTSLWIYEAEKSTVTIGGALI